MTAFHYLLPTLLITAAHAGEITLAVKPFTVSHNLKATVLPETVVPIRLDAKVWPTFEIV